MTNDVWVVEGENFYVLAQSVRRSDDVLIVSHPLIQRIKPGGVKEYQWSSTDEANFNLDKVLLWGKVWDPELIEVYVDKLREYNETIIKDVIE